MPRQTDRWTTRAWTPKEVRAIAGIGPVWRVAMGAGAVVCPTCGAAERVKCTGGTMHIDRLYAHAAVLQSQRRRQPRPEQMQAVADAVLANNIMAGAEVPREAVADDDAFDKAVSAGLLRLASDPERWVLSDLGAARWSVSDV